MKSFFQATPKTPKPPKILLPGSYISEVATWVWDRANAKKRWPAYSQRAKIHPSYKKHDNAYGHLGNLDSRTRPLSCRQVWVMLFTMARYMKCRHAHLIMTFVFVCR